MLDKRGALFLCFNELKRIFYYISYERDCYLTTITIKNNAIYKNFRNDLKKK